jgi:hypothetical protein
LAQLHKERVGSNPAPGSLYRVPSYSIPRKKTYIKTMIYLSLILTSLLALRLVVALPGVDTLEKRDPRDERGSASTTYCFTPGDSGQPSSSDCVALGTQIYSKSWQPPLGFALISHVGLQRRQSRKRSSICWIQQWSWPVQFRILQNLFLQSRFRYRGIQWQ